MRSNLVAQGAESLGTESGVKAFRQGDRRHTQLGSGVEVLLLAWARAGIGQMESVELPVAGERVVEQGDAFMKHGRRLISQVQSQQAETSLHGDPGRIHPIQAGWI